MKYECCNGSFSFVISNLTLAVRNNEVLYIICLPYSLFTGKSTFVLSKFRRTLNYPCSVAAFTCTTKICTIHQLECY